MDENTKKTQDPSRKKAIAKEVFSWVRVVVIALLLTIVIRRLVIVNAEVPTSSMVSLIDPGDRLIGFRLSYLFSEPKRFDVVIFWYPVDRTEKFIKRVIGLPGERVEFAGGQLYVDGAAVAERWVSSPTADWKISLGPDDYLVLGDNRADSYDSRMADMGPVGAKAFLGRVRWILWPLNRFGPVK